jgi:hypothetical protein
MGVQVMNEQRVTTVAPSQDVMNERWRHLTEAVDRIAAQMPLMATRAYLDEKLDDLATKMVGRPEFDRLKWEHEKLKEEMSRRTSESKDELSKQRADLVEKIQENSPKRWRENATAWLSLIAVVVSLLVALGVLKRP